MSAKGRIVVNGERCKGCGLCIWACPKGHIRLAEQEDHRGIRIACCDEGRTCTGCAFCAIICPDVAIEVYKGRRKRLEVGGGRQNVKAQSSKSKYQITDMNHGHGQRTRNTNTIL